MPNTSEELNRERNEEEKIRKKGSWDRQMSKASGGPNGGHLWRTYGLSLKESQGVPGD